MKASEELGNAIRTIRKFKNWSQDDLCVRAGITDKYMTRIERGDPELGEHIYNRVVQALGFKTREDLIAEAGRHPECTPLSREEKVTFGKFIDYLIIKEKSTPKAFAKKHDLTLSHLHYIVNATPGRAGDDSLNDLAKKISPNYHSAHDFLADEAVLLEMKNYKSQAPINRHLVATAFKNYRNGEKFSVIALKLGVSPPTISSIERENTRVSEETIKDIITTIGHDSVESFCKTYGDKAHGKAVGRHTSKSFVQRNSDGHYF